MPLHTLLAKDQNRVTHSSNHEHSPYAGQVLFIGQPGLQPLQPGEVYPPGDIATDESSPKKFSLFLPKANLILGGCCIAAAAYSGSMAVSEFLAIKTIETHYATPVDTSEFTLSAQNHLLTFSVMSIAAGINFFAYWKSRRRLK